jgi:hypothetical protein
MDELLCGQQIVFEILVKGLIGLEAGPEMQQLKHQFQEFIVGLMSLPIKLPGTRLYRSLQVQLHYTAPLSAWVSTQSALPCPCSLVNELESVATLPGQEEDGQADTGDHTGEEAAA